MAACISHAPSGPANESFRGSRGPKAGVRGIPSPFIKIYERGRDTPHPSLLPLLPRIDFLDEVLAPYSKQTTSLAEWVRQLMGITYERSCGAVTFSRSCAM